jgi:multidrug efflux pump subunit AcrB
MAVIISGIVALSLTPSLCVLILKHEHRNPGRFFQAFNRFFARVTHRYVGGVGFMVRRAGIGLALFAGMVLLAVGLWRITPGSLVPDEDQGWFFSAVILPDGASLERTDKVVREVSEIIKSNPPTRTSSPSPASTSSAAGTATTRRRSSSPRSTGTSASSRCRRWWARSS